MEALDERTQPEETDVFADTPMEEDFEPEMKIRRSIRPEWIMGIIALLCALLLLFSFAVSCGKTEAEPQDADAVYQRYLQLDTLLLSREGL